MLKLLGKLIVWLARFSVPPLAPVILLMTIDLLYKLKITHLALFATIYLFYAYLILVVMVMPWYIWRPKEKLEFRTAALFGLLSGALVCLVIICPLFWFTSLDDSFKPDAILSLAHLLASSVFGALTGTFFWLISYNIKGERRSFLM